MYTGGFVVDLMSINFENPIYTYNMYEDENGSSIFITSAEIIGHVC